MRCLVSGHFWGSPSTTSPSASSRSWPLPLRLSQAVSRMMEETGVHRPSTRNSTALASGTYPNTKKSTAFSQVGQGGTCATILAQGYVNVCLYVALDSKMLRFPSTTNRSIVRRPIPKAKA